MLPALALALSVAACLAAGRRQSSVVHVVTVLPGGQNRYYAGNRAPLRSSPLIALPTGSVQAEGWLHTQLEMEAHGFIGHLDQISPWLNFKTSAWANPNGTGDNGWEELPYWLRGATDLAWTLHDKRLIAETDRWIHRIIASAQPDGWFGPVANRTADDCWPNMLAMYALRSYYDGTHDARVLKLMTAYFRWQLNLPHGRFLPESWQKQRGGDNLDSIYWLYDHTGDPFLLKLAARCHACTDNWTDGIPTWHGVNITEGFREPAEYWQQAGDSRFLHATETDYRTVMDTYGEVPGGMFAADENCRPGYTGARQASETCAMVEYMHSDELLTRITGDAGWADRCETVAFNSLPAAMTADLKGLHYLTAPNMVLLDQRSKSPMLQNGGDMLSYNPYEYRCCQHNVSFGWPYFADSLWAATGDNGLAAVLYAPSSVTARVGGGQTVTVHETTSYPFRSTAAFHIGTARPVRFDLVLRIPGWAKRIGVSINGRAQQVPAGAHGWVQLTRVWRSGDTVRLSMPMAVRVKSWPAQHNGVSVYRGPLAFSLELGEKWQPYGNAPWTAYNVLPATPWNYGLLPADLQHFQVIRRSIPAGAQPFARAGAPVEIRAAGQRIADWQLEPNGLIGRLPQSPVSTSAAVTQLTLVPMGCARLRVSVFPTTRGK